MIGRRLCLLLALLLFANTALARNLKLSFAQVAVGDEYVTIIDLLNNGTSTFNGTLEVGDNVGGYLPVTINGTSGSSLYNLNIAPRTVQRFRLTRTGTTVSGHVQVFDNLADGAEEDFTQQISGNLFFQVRLGSSFDSIGVSPSPPMEHFYFPAEYTNEGLTGLAVSESNGATISGIIRAISESGTQIATAPLNLAPWNHQAFFVNQVLSIPVGFKGSIQVETNLPVYALALRLEGGQFSTIQVSPFVSLYDFTITLNDGRIFRGETRFSISNEVVNGSIKFTNPPQDAALKMLPLKGQGGAGSIIASTFTGFANKIAYVFLITANQGPVKTSLDNIGANVVWCELSSAPVGGTFVGVRRH